MGVPLLGPAQGWLGWWRLKLKRCVLQRSWVSTGTGAKSRGERQKPRATAGGKGLNVLHLGPHCPSSHPTVPPTTCSLRYLTALGLFPHLQKGTSSTCLIGLLEGHIC